MPYKDTLKRDEHYKKWSQKPESRLKTRKNWNDYYSRSKNKVRARKLLREAVRSGKIKKLPCRDCGDKNTQAHHEDYSKPFEVIWLCQKHHFKLPVVKIAYRKYDKSSTPQG